MPVWDVAEQSMGYREYLFPVLEGESKIRVYVKDFFSRKTCSVKESFYVWGDQTLLRDMLERTEEENGFPLQ